MRPNLNAGPKIHRHHGPLVLASRLTYPGPGGFGREYNTSRTTREYHRAPVAFSGPAASAPEVLAAEIGPNPQEGKMPNPAPRPEVHPKVGVHVMDPVQKKLVIAFKAYDPMDGHRLALRISRMGEFSGCYAVLCARAAGVDYLPGSMVRGGEAVRA